LTPNHFLTVPQKPKEDWSSPTGWGSEPRPVGRGSSNDTLNHRPDPGTWNPPGPPGPRHPSSWNVQQAPVGRPVEWGDSPTMSRRVPIDDGTSLWGNKQPPNPNGPPGQCKLIKCESSSVIRSVKLKILNKRGSGNPC